MLYAETPYISRPRSLLVLQRQMADQGSYWLRRRCEPVGRYLGHRVSGLFGRIGSRQAQVVCQFIIEGHHPFAQQWAKAISKAQPWLANHPAFKEVVPLERGLHRLKGGLHSQGYNDMIGEWVEELGGVRGITSRGIDEIMKGLKDAGLR